MYRLLQSRILANKLFREYLEKYRYYEIKILGLQTYQLKPVYFTLIIDYFRVKFVNIDDAKYLINTLQRYYMIEVDWIGSKYYGIILD